MPDQISPLRVVLYLVPRYICAIVFVCIIFVCTVVFVSLPLNLTVLAPNNATAATPDSIRLGPPLS